MNRFSLGVAVIVVLLSLPYCSKNGGGGSSDACSTEATLAVTTTPANGSTEPAAPGPSFPLKVSISSTLPSAGVTIVVKARPESGSTAFFTETRPTTSKDNDFIITGTPSTVTCVVEISVTSKSCSSNKWTGSYRYSMK